MTQLGTPPDAQSNEKQSLLDDDEASTDHVQGRQPAQEAESDDEPGSEPKPRRRVSREQPPPGISTRKILVAVSVLFFLWLAYAVRKHYVRKATQPQIIYASRYSKEHKFRPAASPIITETLKDGRIRLRGAVPPSEPTPSAPTPKKKRTRRRTKKSAKNRTKT
ncbi:hypothetical protein BKA70DRAFT_1302053, partial [Coprinopsis sp. MPI-PUGE-AT-0042]